MNKRFQQFYTGRAGSGKRPKAISGVLAKVIKSIGLTGDYDGWMVVTNWSEIVGPSIARQASAISYEDGCLSVAVHDSAWRQELAMRLEELLKEIHSYPYGGSIKQIRLVQGRKGIDNHGDQRR